MAETRAKGRKSKGERKESEADSVSSSENSEPDARQIDWAKLAAMMRNAPPEAVLAMAEHFTPTEQRPQQPRKQAMVLTPEETDALNSGYGIPEAASVGSDHTVVRPELQKGTKQPPKKTSLIAA